MREEQGDTSRFKIPIPLTGSTNRAASYQGSEIHDKAAGIQAKLKIEL